MKAPCLIRARRGQNALEFIILLGFLLIVFVAFTIAMQGKIREQQFLNKQALYVQLSDKIEREFILAARVNGGYMRGFDIPKVLNGEPYNVTIEDKDTLVIRGNQSANEYLRFLGVNVTLVRGGDLSDNLVPPGVYDIIIQKNDSGLYLRKDCVINGLSAANCI